jgi:hypothetical protein
MSWSSFSGRKGIGMDLKFKPGGEKSKEQDRIIWLIDTAEKFADDVYNFPSKLIYWQHWAEKLSASRNLLIHSRLSIGIRPEPIQENFLCLC